MSYLEINNLIVGKYDVSITIEDHLTYGVFCRDKNYISRFLYSLTGINKSKNLNACLYKDKSIFDNQEYFENRLYMDFAKNYIKTLNADYIQKSFAIRFGINFNTALYKEAMKETNIRNEVLVKNEYEFTNYGVNASGYCVLKGLNFPNIIIDNPVIKPKTPKVKELIIKQINNKGLYNTSIYKATNPFDFYQYMDKLIILNDFNEAIIVNPHTDLFLILDDNIVIDKKNKIFQNDQIIICLNIYTKDELKEFTKKKIKYKIIDFIETMKFVGIPYEKK